MHRNSETAVPKKPPGKAIDPDLDMTLPRGAMLPKVCPFKDQVACIEEACILLCHFAASKLAPNRPTTPLPLTPSLSATTQEAGGRAGSYSARPPFAGSRYQRGRWHDAAGFAAGAGGGAAPPHLSGGLGGLLQAPQ